MRRKNWVGLDNYLLSQHKFGGWMLPWDLKSFPKLERMLIWTKTGYLMELVRASKFREQVSDTTRRCAVILT